MKEEVKEYYGKILKTNADLKTDVCCTQEQFSGKEMEALRNVHPKVTEKYYGCGLTIPTQLQGKKVLDLGCGSGRDVFILSQMVGSEGKVVGLDMTPEQIQVAKEMTDHHMKKFNFAIPNVSFIEDSIENIENIFNEDEFDIIVSNCVINLCVDKKRVLKGIYKILRTGGEFYFSDIYANRRLPKHLREDKILYGECLSGALYWKDFINLSKEIGFKDPRQVDDKIVKMNTLEIENKLKNFEFYSRVYRLFKMELDYDCEEYGQYVSYKGSIEEHEDNFKFDSKHLFPRGKKKSVCGNTFKMLSNSRFSKHFNFYGNFENHMGSFEKCGTEIKERAVTCC